MKDKKPLGGNGSNSPQNVLARICQNQAVSIDVVSKGGSPVLIEGPIDKFKWDEIMEIAGLTVNSIGLLEGFSAQKVSMHQKIECSNGVWNPVVELRSQDFVETDVDVVQSICELTIHKLMPRVEDVQDMLLPDLGSPIGDKIDELATMFLERRGGRVISDEIQLAVGDRIVCKIQGKTKAKPNKSNFTPVSEILEGRFTGFDAEDREFYFRQSVGGKLHIVYDSTDLDVMDIADFQKSGKEYKVVVKKTVQKNGNPLYTYFQIQYEDDQNP